ncbi:NuoI/complex I 23 kDa subunit family protein [Desulfobacca acetoxidans]|uniref:NADH-quinone oxidoreductase subunit I n=1 Tax=Desulfobacca acetoxidans (strain ATCC 700848 / DSM 11109 / ASRB2) TaxID=880072 RepID=F2NJZ4_DESAR|nr:NADH-quinone oxidoreductase subunit I [Desulfobacca acetoxidans]AEB09938.1 NAD(P)H-quinone oxidoreductase subunit I [Desulfobacca acetoxidans DSM 11109]HAY21041.1 NADH-quinone oxidoreductase subunit I [Desulfobacterales bacterium]
MIIPLLKGLGTTFKALISKPITIQYPEERRPVSDRFRGRPELQLHENGKVKCVACTLCKTVCPSQAILAIEAAEGTYGEKYPIRFEIDLTRCIFCGFCQEACPKAAIALNKEYELAQYDKSALLYDLEMLKKKS